MAVLYPQGYGTNLVTLEAMEARHGPHMHPEYRRRLFVWLASTDGQLGIGGGWRATGSQPDKPGFAPEGKSFHQDQTFASGVVGSCAVDLVVRNPGGVHRAPTWAEVPAQGSAESLKWGVHCNIASETWHMQPVEIDGWQSWVNAGRPDPVANYPIPTKDDMIPLDIPERIFDSRDTYEFRPDEIRTIPVGSTQAFLHVTLLSSAPGYVSISGSDIRSYASLVNADTQGGVSTGGAPISCPDGSVRVYAKAGGHIIVDVYARG